MLIPRRSYHTALTLLFEKAGFLVLNQRLGRIVVTKQGSQLYVALVGKNLPYVGRNGKEAFIWESYIPPKKLESIESEATSKNAEAWIGYCYAIANDEYLKSFQTIVTLDGISFGARLISTEDFRKNMRPRSNSWSMVDLPRTSVIEITRDPAAL